jgi:hypothetical protein
MKNGGDGGGLGPCLDHDLFPGDPCDLDHDFHGYSSSCYLSSERSTPCYLNLTFCSSLFPRCFASGYSNQGRSCLSKWLLKEVGVEHEICDEMKVAAVEGAETESFRAGVEEEEKLEHLARKTEVGAEEVQFAKRHPDTFD